MTTPSPLSWKTVTVFISSTFNDMHAERDYLVKRVFPELREWCEQRKLRLVDIDLRWGVTEADATSRNTVKVCLKRIDESRPFFLCFLGQRRGWVPEKGDIAADTCEGFENLRTYIGKNSVTEMEIEHAVIAPMNGQQRAENSFFYLREPSYLDDLPAEPAFIRNTYTNEGILNADERKVADEELWIWREVKIPATGRPVHHYTATWNPKEKTPEIALPLQCPSMDPQNQAQWMNQWRNLGIEPASLDLEDDPDFAELARTKNEEITTGRLGTFSVEDKDLAAVILKDLKEAIEHRFPEHMVARMETPLQKEIDQQEQFLELNCTGFIRRTGDFDDLNRYVASGSQDLFVLTAPAGMGKTMLLANWIRSFQILHGTDRPVFYRFIGASDGSTTVDSVLRNLLNEIKEAGYLPDEIPVDPLELRNVLFGLLKSIGSRTRLLIVIDALNQLESGLKDLTWLPKKLPAGVQVIVSFKREEGEAEEIATDFRRILPETYAEVRPFESAEDRKALVAAYLDQYLKKLDDILVQVLIESPGASNPLYLKVVLSELRVYGSFANLSQKIRNDFGISPIEAFGAVLQRLERDPAFTAIPFEEAVPLLFGLISHARVGLSEQELVSLFAREMSGCSNDAFLETIRLLMRQVRPFIATRQGRSDFFYDSFRLAAVVRYEGENPQRGQRSSQDWHRSLAGYFEALPAWVSQDEMKPTLRRAAELPYHLAWAGMGDRLAKLVLKDDLLESVVYGLGPFESILDIEYARAPPIPLSKDLSQESITALSLLQGAIRLSQHVLAPHPEELPSQLHGRLLGTGNCAVDQLLEGFRTRIRRPWLRPITASLTAPGGPLIRTLAGHTETVRTVVVTPDGRRAVSMSQDRTLKIWDLESGLELATLAGHNHVVNEVAVTPDGRRAVTGSSDNTLKVWDIETGRELRTLTGHTGDVNAVAVTPDGRRAISGSDDTTLKVWDLESGRELHTLVGHTDRVIRVAVTPDGRRAVSVSFYHTLKVWDLESGRERNTFTGHTSYINAIAVTPDSRFAISGSDDRTLKIWDLESGRERYTLTGHTSYVNAVAVTPDGRRAVSCSADKNLKVWDLESGRELATLAGHTEPVRRIAVTPDGRCAISGSDDRTLKTWDLESGRELATLAGHIDWVSALAITPDGTTIVSGSGDDTLKVWNLGNCRELHTLTGHTDSVNAVAVTPDGRRAVSCSTDQNLKIWDLESGRELATLAGHIDNVNAVVVSPDGRCAISGSDDRTLKIWDLESSRELATLAGHTQGVTAVAVTPDSRRAVSGSDDTTLKVWNLESGRELHTLASHTRGITTVAVMPDGRRAISGSDDTTLKVWNLESGRELHTLASHINKVDSVVITPDGRRAVSGSAIGHTMKVWDLESGRELRTHYGSFGFVHAAAVTPDGRRAISGSGSPILKVLEVWDLESGRKTHIGHTLDVVGVAVMPDGHRAVSWSRDHTLKVWNLESGGEVASYSAEARIRRVAVSSTTNTIIAGGVSGTVDILRLENDVQGPAIVTGWRDSPTGPLRYRCTSCGTESVVGKDDFGTVVTCPSCTRPHRLNPFVVETLNQGTVFSRLCDLFSRRKG